jgi:probable H4MPT-linked C1 transfer pathway protein
MSQNKTIGWDVGGAHLKAALLDAEGMLQQVLQVPCALWRGLHELEAAIDVVLHTFSIQSAHHAITMTGELVDLFENRQSGVQSISQVMNNKLDGVKQYYAGNLYEDYAGFVTIDEVDIHWSHIASANWLASASFVAQHLQHGLLIDIGSTTSDFVLIESHRPVCLGLTDASRMQTEELVYTGVIRTPLMAVTQKIKFENIMTSVAAEYFSTMADVYRLTGDLQAEDDMADTADGKEKTSFASARRIARMIGHDADDEPLSAWIALAYEFKSQHVLRLQEVATKHLARTKNKQNVKIIGAGAGSFLAREISANMNIQFLDVVVLLKDTMHTEGMSEVELGHRAGVCLPAYAVAYLAYNRS